MQIWYTSDTHFWHDNIIQFCKRPFANAKEMNERLVTYWNAFVKPQDHVWHLGDVTMLRSGSDRADFIKLCRSLNGHKRLILGNHDHFPIKTYIEAGFEKICASTVFHRLLFTHIPVHPRSVYSQRANVHGHTHEVCYDPVFGLDKDRELIVWPYVNICVEQTNYHPIALEEVEARVEKAIEAPNSQRATVPDGSD